MNCIVCGKVVHNPEPCIPDLGVACSGVVTLCNRIRALVARENDLVQTVNRERAEVERLRGELAQARQEPLFSQRLVSVLTDERNRAVEALRAVNQCVIEHSFHHDCPTCEKAMQQARNVLAALEPVVDTPANTESLEREDTTKNE